MKKHVRVPAPGWAIEKYGAEYSSLCGMIDNIWKLEWSEGLRGTDCKRCLGTKFYKTAEPYIGKVFRGR